MKRLLALVAADDINEAEITNISSQIALYGITTDRYDITSKQSLKEALNNGNRYDYIYLATHGCDTHWGNISGTLSISWIEFAAQVCMSECINDSAIFMHSCCRGGLNQVAWKMFFCCEKIQFVCGPRHNLTPPDLIIAFNLFLYNLEVRRIDPVVSASKVLSATDIRLVCFDRIETEVEVGYTQHCASIEAEVDKAFEDPEESI